MKKSEAIKEAAVKLLGASDTAAAAVMRLGGIRMHALEDGPAKHIIRQMRKLNEVAKELHDLAENLDWDIDETKTITNEVKQIEEVK
jgi:uncharacterized protein Yka (UPF0111/DUF47 family)